jgi:hypothetical protein
MLKLNASLLIAVAFVLAVPSIALADKKKTSASSEKDMPTETVTFQYGGLNTSYSQQKSKPNREGGRFKYDLKANKGALADNPPSKNKTGIISAPQSAGAKTPLGVTNPGLLGGGAGSPAMTTNSKAIHAPSTR